jgi:hypothetical protein
VAVLPLVRPEPTEQERDPEKIHEPEEPVGALIVERIEDSRIPETMAQRVAVVTEHSSIALANAMEHQNLFLMPVWRALGKTRWVFHARTLPKTLAIAGAVVALILCFIFVPWPYEIEADGTLEPVERSSVFVRVDGTVKQMHTKHGALVEKGDLLVELRNTEVGMRKLAIVKEMNATLEELRNKDKVLKNRRYRDDEERARLGGEIDELEAKAANLELQLAVYQEKEKDLKILSPRRGRVITWDLQKLLENRPVQLGQELMEVADTEGPWQLELKMPDDRMGPIVHAMKQRREQGLDDADALPVTFFLWTEAGVKHKGTVKEIDWSAEVRGEEGNTVLIKVDIEDFDPDKLADLRAGAGVTAKVYCYDRSIGYKLFRDLWAWVQSRILFRF